MARPNESTNSEQYSAYTSTTSKTIGSTSYPLLICIQQYTLQQCTSLIFTNKGFHLQLEVISQLVSFQSAHELASDLKEHTVPFIGQLQTQSSNTNACHRPSPSNSSISKPVTCTTSPGSQARSTCGHGARPNSEHLRAATEPAIVVSPGASFGMGGESYLRARAGAWLAEI